MCIIGVYFYFRHQVKKPSWDFTVSVGPSYILLRPSTLVNRTYVDNLRHLGCPRQFVGIIQSFHGYIKYLVVAYFQNPSMYEIISSYVNFQHLHYSPNYFLLFLSISLRTVTRMYLFDIMQLVNYSTPDARLLNLRYLKLSSKTVWL